MEDRNPSSIRFYLVVFTTIALFAATYYKAAVSNKHAHLGEALQKDVDAYQKSHDIPLPPYRTTSDAP